MVIYIVGTDHGRTHVSSIAKAAKVWADWAYEEGVHFDAKVLASSLRAYFCERCFYTLEVKPGEFFWVERVEVH